MEYPNGRAGKREDQILEALWEVCLERDALKLELMEYRDEPTA